MRCANRERTVDEVAVPSDSAAVGRARKDVIATMEEHPFEGLVGLEEVPGRGVFDSFGLPRRPAQVHDFQRCFGIHRRHGTID